MIMKWLDKFIGRYFFVWLISSGMMFKRVISEENWFWLTIAYLTGGVASKGMEIWQSRKK